MVMNRADRSATRPAVGRTRPRLLLGLAAAALALLVCALLLLAPRLRGGRWRMPTRPPEGWNLLLVSLDTTRPDRLAACDGGPVATPALDRLRGGGFLFAEMIAPAPNTLPAHASLFTGRNPYLHGVRENTEHALGPQQVTLAERLSAAGYETAAFVAAFVMDARFGLGQGFGLYEDRLSEPESGLAPFAVELRGEIVAERAARWLFDYAGRRAQDAGQPPFFLFVHFYDAHAPYQPPPHHAAAHPGRPYEGELAYQDVCLGRLLDALEATGEAPRTWVWVVSDHGESLGEHGEATHSLFVYEAPIRVVSILRPPPPDGRYRAGAPHARCTSGTSLISVPPTLLEIAGVPLARTAAETGDARSTERIEGRSLLPWMEGAELPSDPIYCETLSPWISYHWAPLYAVRTPQWKYIRAPEAELYDLERDPRERDNLIAERPARAAELAGVLEAYLSSAGEADGDARRVATEAERARLRSLGYIASESRAAPEADRPDPKRMVRFFHTRYQTGKNLLYRGRYDEAARALREALQLDPLNNSLLVYLGTALRESGRPEAASRALRQAVGLQPASPRAWNGWGRSLLRCGRPDSARWAHEQARRLIPNSPEAWMGLGDVNLHLGQYAPAAAAYDSALARGGDAAYLHGLLARLYRERLHDPTAAERHLRAFARLRGVDARGAAAQLPPLPEP
ncbi:MAG: sulfatase-like hydrolase/transferase [Candidatus Eisenbacteria bacterium]|nr:sulfatase-like hydrolase/transferase [Candidatus Eisenbacteria bacterium]